MRFLSWLFFSSVLLAASAGFAQDAWSSGSQGNPVTNKERVEIPGLPGVAHYSADFKIGAGLYDVIGLHRVTKEASPGVPASQYESVFLIHGDTIGAVPSFFVGSDGGVATSIAGALASKGIDVWAIDLRWVKTPASAIQLNPQGQPLDPSSDDFMASWNLDRQVKDVQIGMIIARAIRMGTGSWPGKFSVLGYSSGGIVAYALAGAEAQLSPILRQVKTLAILDVAFKTNDPSFGSTVCAIADQLQAQVDAGIVVDAGGGLISLAATLAEISPNDPTPLLPGPFSNEQVGLILSGATHMLQPYLPHYHLSGAYFDDQSDLPTGLRFSDFGVFLGVAQQAAPFEPLPYMIDARRTICSDTVYDDHLGQIQVPVLYVGASGGFGSYGLHSTTLLGSYPANVETIIVSVTGDPFTDYGHDDIGGRAPDWFARWGFKLEQQVKSH